MNTTVIHRGSASEHRSHLLTPAPSDARGRGSHEPVPSAFTSFQRAVAALGAVALVGALGAFPFAAEAVTCTAGKRGTLNDNNTFTEGTTSSHVDYRIVCTGDAAGRLVTGDDLDAALDHADADPLDDDVYLDKFVLELSNAYWHFYDDEVGDLPTLVVLGNVQADSGSTGVRISGDGMDPWSDWNIESHASIRTTGGGTGITVYLGTDPYYRTLRVRNFGLIETTGGGSSDGDRRGRGMNIEPDGGDVEAINESGGSVTTRGPGARGVTAGTPTGSPTAINRGTITTHGGGFVRRGSLQTSEGLYTWADAAGAVAQSINESGGVIETNGDGARGIVASTWKGAGSIALATNKGQVTTRGDRLVLGGRSQVADGVHASGSNGLSRATNEAGASIETKGKGAVGLWAGNIDRRVPSVGGRAEVENRGTITTSGDATDTNHRSHGMQATSRYGSAYAANHEGATVTTSGRGARGVEANSAERSGDPDEAAYALNRGTIKTTGDGLHSDSSVYNALGLAAFSGGDSPAVAVNAREGEIETTGTGAKGVWAVAYRNSGAASATNRGDITTRGDAYRADREGTDSDTYRRSDGLAAYSSGSDAAVANEVGGVIETHGAVAYGVHAGSAGGSASAVNQGRVTTNGGTADDLPGAVGRLLGSRGVHSLAPFNAYAENGLTGRVDTHGDRAFALMAESTADGTRTSAIAEVVNSGQARTRGHNADGVVAIIPSGTADNPNYARATNAAGASSTTAGAGASGLTAGIYVTGGTATDAHGIAIARNDGTVVTGHIEDDEADPSTEEMAAGVDASNGVVAVFWSPDGTTTITNAGDVAVVNTGDVTVKRENASGLYAETFGTGKAWMRVVGGSVSVEGESGRGLWARTGTTGAIEAIIAESSRIVADSGDGVAAEFDGGVTDVRLLDSSLVGDVDFGSGTDTFTVRDGRVTGAIDFGGGTDALNAHGDSWLEGAISNLESLSKRGSGNLVLRDDANFSSGASATIEGGGLVFTGEFNLGTTGTMRIHDAARLTAVLADPANPPLITAGGGITFDGDVELFVQVAPDITAAQETTYLDGFDDTTTSGTNPVANYTPVTGRTGQLTLRTARGPSTVVDVGHISLEEAVTCTAIGCPDITGLITNTANTVVTSGVRLGEFTLDAPGDATDLAVDGLPTIPMVAHGAQSGTGLTLGGGVSALGAALFDVFDAEPFSFAPDEVRESDAPLVRGYFDTRTRDGDVEYWARSWSDDATVLAGGTQARMQGAEMGVKTPLERGFLLGISTAPEVSVSTSGGGTRLDGARYAVQGGWRGETFHAVASVSEGRYRARSVSDNPVAGGGLGGTFGLTQDHVQLDAGARLAWSGVRVAPSLSVLSGVLDRDAHTANGAAFRADVPAFSQRYHGWKGELNLSSEQWLRGPGSLRWRPALNLYTQHTQTTGPASVDVAQHDRAGVLSLTSSARVSGLPRTVHGFDATVEAMRSQTWRVQLGFAGMQSDGEYDQAMYARLRARF